MNFVAKKREKALQHIFRQNDVTVEQKTVIENKNWPCLQMETEDLLCYSQQKKVLSYAWIKCRQIPLSAPLQVLTFRKHPERNPVYISKQRF